MPVKEDYIHIEDEEEEEDVVEVIQEADEFPGWCFIDRALFLFSFFFQFFIISPILFLQFFHFSASFFSVSFILHLITPPKTLQELL